MVKCKCRILRDNQMVSPWHRKEHCKVPPLVQNGFEPDLLSGLRLQEMHTDPPCFLAGMHIALGCLYNSCQVGLTIQQKEIYGSLSFQKCCKQWLCLAYYVLPQDGAQMPYQREVCGTILNHDFHHQMMNLEQSIFMFEVFTVITTKNNIFYDDT
jgi:hypothetical protein